MAKRQKKEEILPAEENFKNFECFNTKMISKGYEKDKVDYYFDSYSHFSIHEQMLKDIVKLLGQD
jgi:hypothetical protein